MVQLREVAMVEQKKVPYEENEDISQKEHKRGISAWNLELDDLKFRIL